MELLTGTRRRILPARTREVRIAESLAAALVVCFAVLALAPPVLGLHQRVVDVPGHESTLGTLTLSRTVPTGDLGVGDRVVRSGDLRVVTGRDADAIVLDNDARVTITQAPTSAEVLVAAPYARVLVAAVVSAFAVLALLALARWHRRAPHRLVARRRAAHTRRGSLTRSR